MKIYTKTGDKGTTGLFGGTRVGKDDVRVECYGTFDEVNSFIGLLRSKLPVDHAWQERLHEIQMLFMNMMSHLATPSTATKPNTAPLPVDGAVMCEGWIDELEAQAGPSDYFLLPGGTEVSALCHVVRTQVRRGERLLVRLMKEDTVDPSILSFVNRLSDLFFAMARAEMAGAGVSEERWNSFLYKKKKRRS
ncbi:cob(I)yrinic acid a,c-diamide adenosyltransferase [Prosthecochloris sp. N3]|uniref:Corrinoid adenosyltransferase n=1 Tax=Prosthecochloris ethylica TaxID=2743976 RepID=A0ABR9XSE2_9CHLB|nr:cob(I)yrinic acid a,c-diamide adenosyltransferase [Prosthecochloris ethylica]MBF0585332.1 cob(I)yrinic acid a,c-diamide adenosyltransferase [Prosthecochloris ethylica]MBF0636868.1 cob(I)yrinic acid a,c-diamide adenosyltransferase [Prosthecochloris ethylica]NUK46561.1 cob(I)yrinic acid a,c-diamide adenosyltransferase [Prosthecochloris ethylica]